jgi:hypothetical protein
MAPTKATERIRTERRTPTPTKMTFAGENTCQIKIRIQITDSWPGAYQANTFSEGIRKGTEDMDRRVEPFGQAVIGTLRSIKLLDLLLKHGENAAGRIASLELGSERVRKEVLLCASLISIQGVIEKLEEVGGRCRSRLSVRHIGRSEFVDDGDGGDWYEGIRTASCSPTCVTGDN